MKMGEVTFCHENLMAVVLGLKFPNFFFVVSFFNSISWISTCLHPVRHLKFLSLISFHFIFNICSS